MMPATPAAGTPTRSRHWWPRIDQAAWDLNCAPGDPLDDEPYAGTLRPDTLVLTCRSYGRWLLFLDRHGWLDVTQAPLERVTRPRLRRYFHDLLDQGVADFSIIARFTGLERALKILAPGRDVAWVSRPDGTTIYALLAKTRRPLVVPDTAELLAWAHELMDTADAAACPRDCLATYRDGLAMALFATRGRRLRAMSLLDTRDELVLRQGRYWIELRPHRIKTDRYDRFPLPDDLTEAMRHYLDVVRLALLDGHAHDALWISTRRTPLTPKGMQEAVRRRSRKRFGIGFGPHRFRHALATAAALHQPDQPDLAAGVLGISQAIIDRHYNRLGMDEASAAFEELLDQRRHELAASDG